MARARKKAREQGVNDARIKNTASPSQLHERTTARGAAFVAPDSLLQPRSDLRVNASAPVSSSDLNQPAIYANLLRSWVK